YPFALNNDHEAVISKNINDRAASLWILNGKVEVWYGAGSGSAQLVSNATLPINQWSHISATYDGTNLSIYINGVLDISAAKTVPPTNSLDLTIGQRGDGQYYFNGNIDEVRIWQSSLNATQISNLSGTRLTGNEDFLVAYYNTLSYPANNILRDFSGNNLN